MSELEPGHSQQQSMDSDGNSRRSFMKWAIGGISVAATAIMAWPMVGNVVGPIYHTTKLHFSKVKKVDDIPTTGPRKIAFPFIKEDAFLREQEEHEVWVIKKPSGEITVFSPICPHMGCRYRWHADLQEFICPCHGSVFAENGKVLGGPAPRPLDTLPHKVQDKILMVEWERFEVGIPQKIRI